MGAGRSGNFALLRNGFCSSGFFSSETFLSNKHNYKELTVISIAHRNTLPPELRAKVDETRCIALSNRPGSYIALDHMEEKINLYMAETTRGKLRLENCHNLVRQAALHKNVLLPAKERIEEALNFGGIQEITAGSRARMEEVDAVVAKLEDKLGNNWAEFTSSRNSFHGVEANSIVRNLDSWRGTEQERRYVLEKCEDHGIG